MVITLQPGLEWEIRVRMDLIRKLHLAVCALSFQVIEADLAHTGLKSETPLPR